MHNNFYPALAINNRRIARLAALKKELKFLLQKTDNNRFFFAKFNFRCGIFSLSFKENYQKLKQLSLIKSNSFFIFLSINQLLIYFDLTDEQIFLIQKVNKYHPIFQISKDYLIEEYKDDFYFEGDSVKITIFLKSLISQEKIKKRYYSGFSYFSGLMVYFLDEKGPLFFSEFPNKTKEIKKFAKETTIYFSSFYFTYPTYPYAVGKFTPTIINIDNNFSILREGRYASKIKNIINKYLDD
ncbi:hypothetical protein JTY60_02480 [symbiont of Argiope bruennichi]|uniref:hypothetical protein n=1 Tax=symbiont of Argiope bruennichi TaxID=2810479 RepID=UPI003DA36E4C